jgi:hypothetical protein
MPRPVTTAAASSSRPVTSSAWSPSARDEERRARDVRVGAGFRRCDRDERLDRAPPPRVEVDERVERPDPPEREDPPDRERDVEREP